MDEVFRALSDPTRRALLDELFREDGQTLSALQARAPMTRFGVMKHLGVLERAGLLTTRRRGREKLHFLNPIPIRLVHDRWVSKYSEPWAVTLAGLKMRLEADMTSTADSAKRPWTATAEERVFEIYIQTTPELLWEAITDRDTRRKYSFGLGASSNWEPGSKYELITPQGSVMATGENIKVDPPRLLVQSFTALWSEEVKAQGTSLVTWEIEQVADSCRLTVTHGQLLEDANSELYGGWPMILSGLKTLLETGDLLTTPGSLRYSRDGDPA